MSIENNVLERSSFCSVAHRLTRAQDRSLRVLDFNIIDFLHDSKQKISTTIESFRTPENLAAVKLLQIDLDISHNVVQHH